MAVTKTIGKNTLGDNEKMRVHLHDYEMSSHNLSYVFRSTVGVGMLVPFMKIVAQKGDIFDIQLTNKTMTHPTRGPLFGAFKLQHFVFTAGFRLYNSWLHNNRTGIGMKMSDIKLPRLMSKSEKAGDVVFNPSSLYSYLGLKGYRRITDGRVIKQGVPYLIYLDIFKNYFANTQEDKFYAITHNADNPKIKVTITGQNSSEFKVNDQYQRMLTTTVGATTINLQGPNDLANISQFWGSLSMKFTKSDTGESVTMPINQISNDISTLTITLNNTTDFIKSCNELNGIFTTEGKEDQYISSQRSALTAYPLILLDYLRDEILKKPGNSALSLNETENTQLNTFMNDIHAAQQHKLGGMLLKTYDSDIFNNWVKTDWIDGENGINKITALKPDADGNITMDALNLQQKVYNMLNRIAVSGGTYRDWLETVYTAGRYLDRPETPVFQGGISQIIEFDEVVATSANEADSQVLGDLAGRGYARRPNGSGHLHFQVEEPGYVFGVLAITPMTDYSQGNDFDLNILTMDDLHKPALDGIGYQDSMNEQRAWWTADNSQGGIPKNDSTPGKTVAWIDYMTNFNKTFGNFAAGENEDFMVLNRNFKRSATNGIENITTYINPQEHIDIFADTAIDSQNFWVQTACEITKRGNYSAKQIPNL